MGAIRVLIIEDDNDIIDLVRSVLEPDFECFTAGNGMEGLQQAVRGEPDLVICDIMMPVMDGWEFMRKLRAMRGYAHMPVVFLSALSSRSHIREGYELGISLFQPKPIDPQRFRRLIEMFVKDRGIVARPKRLDIKRVRQLGFIQETPTPKPSAPEPSATRPPASSARQAAPAPIPSPIAGAPTLPRIEISMPPPPPPDVMPRVLIVEDDPDSSGMVHAALKADFEVIETRDGITAIDLAVRYKPDIFIIDGMLPRMTGYQLTVMLKKNREFYRTPIIFISGKATSRDRDYVARLGVMDFMAKPFSGDQIRRLALSVTRRADFTVRTDRIPSAQVRLEQLQRLETHRATGPRFRVENPAHRPEKR